MGPARSLRRKLILSVFLALVLSFGSPHALRAEAPEKRPMTFMDVMEMRGVSSGSISPDGRYVLYAVSIPQWKVGKNFTDLFVAPTDGSAPPRQMTFTKEKNHTQPHWARDSKTFGFLSDREGSNQLYLMRIDGGEARKISDAKDGVNAFAFSRDGKWVAFSAGKPEQRQIWLAALDSEQAPMALTKHATAVGAWAWSPDSLRVFFVAPDHADPDEVKRKEKKFDVRIMDAERTPNHLWSVQIGDKTEKRWTAGDAYGVDQFSIADNSSLLAFRTASTNRHANVLDQEESEIYTLDLSTGETRRLTNNKVPESVPSFSPDSKWLVFTTANEFTPGRNLKPYVAPTAGGPLRKLVADWDYNVRLPSWSSDSKTLYFTEGVGVDSNLFAVSLSDGKLTQLTRERGVVGGPGFDRETGYFLLTFTDPSTPIDYYVARPETIAQRSRWVRVSRANPQVEGFQLAEYETVRWNSTDGQMVEGILAHPIGGRDRAPLIVQLHGGPASAYQNSFSGSFGTYVHIYAANGYAVFQPNYRGSDNYGEKFRTQIVGDYFRQGYDDIMTGVDALIARGIADPAKLGMMGWSAGGHWSDWTLTHTNRFKAISTGAGAGQLDLAVRSDRYAGQPRAVFQRRALGKLGALRRSLAAALHPECQDTHTHSCR